MLGLRRSEQYRKQGNDGGNEWSWKEDVAVLTSHAKVVETVESKEQFWNDVLICFKETMGTTTRTHNAVKFRFTKYLKHNRHLYQGALQG